MDFTEIEENIRYVLNFIGNRQVTQSDSNVEKGQQSLFNKTVLALRTVTNPSQNIIVRMLIITFKNCRERLRLAINQCENKVLENAQKENYYKFRHNEILNSKYQIMVSIHRGTFAEVILAYSVMHKTNVAIKICNNADTCRLIFKEEAFLLQCVKQCKNRDTVLQMKDYFYYNGHPCMVLELLYTNLENEINNKKNRGFAIGRVRELTRSILEGLCSLEEMSILHCDLRPKNIVIANRLLNKVKIVDYGNCFYGNQLVGAYGQTQNYRSPEMILRLPFGHKINIWSLGCIVVELFTGHPLFSATDEEDMMAAVIELLGIPNPRIPSLVEEKYFRSDGFPMYLLREDGSLKEFPKETNRLMPGNRKLDLILFKSKSKIFVDFVSQCLQWHPHNRFTAQEALNHPFMKRKK